MACGIHAIDRCPEPWWHLYAGFWAHLGMSLYQQHRIRVPRPDFQLWVLNSGVALTEFAAAQQRGFEYVSLHRCCIHHGYGEEAHGRTGAV